jgi:carboxyl-terminal processing protease
VRLTIERAGDPKPREVELVREVINIESVLGDRRGEDGGWRFQLESDPRIAHVRIASFGERTPMELERVLASVIANGAKAIALDLRGDAGGSLESAVAVCQMLLPTGRQIVKTRGREGALRASYTTTEDGAFLDVPLVVLVNQDSASASEIVAACLQDNERAAIAGQRSYGKGTVQQLIPVQNGQSLLKLTWASFWRPNKKKIHRAPGEAESATWGVVPNPGLERRLSDEEYARFQEYRSARDRIGPAADEAAPGNDGKSAPSEFVDEQLQLAVKHLQGKVNDATR